MSSSVFIESSSIPKRAADSLEAEIEEHNDFPGIGSSKDSNLVVVYGKNGINFDRKGLENLIEEKTLSSISVIRLTSPTPSMEAEEEEAEIQENLNRKEKGSDDNSETTDELTGNEDDSNESDDREKLSMGERESSSNEGEEASADEIEKSLRRKKRSKAKRSKDIQKKVENIKRKRKKERPEIVGLTVEEFYPPEDAQQMAKEILKLAGVSTFKRTADFEFQLYVIRNDHCYTPFTSPEQMKAKLTAEKLDSEKATLMPRKINPQTTGPVKQLISKKKIPSVESSKSLINRKVEMEKSETKTQTDKGKPKEKPKKFDEDTNEYISDDDEIESSASEDEDFESDFSTSEISAESANDRDSDLDFDLNNRRGRKKKALTPKTNKRALHQKLIKRNQQQSQDEAETVKPIITATKTARQTTNDFSRIIERKNLPNVSPQIKLAAGNASIIHAKNTIGVHTQKAQPPLEAALPTVKKVVTEKITNPVPHQITIAAASRRGPIVQVGSSSPRTSQLSHATSSKVLGSPQTVKEIVINKVMASPKGGFTEIGALLSQSDIQAVSIPLTPTSTRTNQKSTPSSKGFMPLGIETAAQNQLPSQISIQTHQSSSELAAEQLELIDSIVKDEMEKSSIIEKAAGVNENIPQLVKMLESTEMALESKKTQQINTFTTANTVEDIDITNAPLLETPEDEIPDDFLQHVVELIEDDKTLQEAVEKQVFGEDSSVHVESVAPTLLPLPAPPVLQQSDNSRPNLADEQKSTILTPQTPNQTKSIIQASLSNVVATPSPTLSSTANNTSRSLNLSKSIPTVRKEPIQIIRGNGRVITLPPIEAPTTRAKRRAQTQPLHLGDSLQTALSESQDTSLQSNASISTDSGATNVSSVDKKQIETATSRRRVSKEGTVTAAAAKAAKKVAKKVSAKTAVKKDEEDDASESQGDDDDPNKLWCICRQPHNNRFMICCDACEDWFHGTCVNITKAMGLEMEQRGIDWTCPKCVKKNEEKKQPKITDMLEVQKIVTQSAQQDSCETKVQIDSGNSDHGIVTAAEPLPKKQIIDIKKIQSGQFISLNNLEQKKLPVTVLTSAQKKQLPISTSISTPTPTVKSVISPTATQPKRIIVVQKMTGQKSVTPNKTVTLVKSLHQQQLKLQKVQVSPMQPTPTTERPKTETVTENIEPSTPCIVCKKPARANSIYCSDDCIRKHAQNALNVFSAKTPDPTPTTPHSKLGTDDKKKKSKGLFEDLLSMADRKPKVERVYVFERKSGRVLTGSNAPTTANLKKWLQDNPTFEVVQPGSAQALEIEKKQKQRSSFPTKSALSPTSIIPPENEPSTAKKSAVLSTQKSDGQSATNDLVIETKHVKNVTDQSKFSSPNVPRAGTPKQLTKYPQQVVLKPDKLHKTESRDEIKSKEKAAKRQSSDGKKSGNSGPASEGKKSGNSAPATESSSDPEPIRLNVRRTLQEQLCQRISELVLTKINESDSSTKLTSAEVEQFVKETESEMYNLFNRDTGSKYRAKYRSLMFNIKDRKNTTLFQKICAKAISPKQLVRMTPEELASQELAQWRENENKHQLEMIKKSELDLLSCAKNYVLKTHKGEEVIEGKSTDCVNLDITIPVEDVVSVLNNSSGGDQVEETVPRKEADILKNLYTKSISSGNIEVKLKVAKEREYDRENDREHDRDYERDREREKRHKSKDRHREKSKSRKRSRSHSRSRSREKRHKSSHKEEKRDRDEHDRDKGREKDRGRARERHEKKSNETITVSSTVTSPLTIKSTGSVIKEKNKESNVNVSLQPKKDKGLEAFNLIDQILESTKTVEEAANLVTEKKEMNAQSAVVTSHSSVSQSNTSSLLQSNNSTDSDQEPTSTVSITSSPQDPYSVYTNDESASALWSGSISMIDVASFQIAIQSVVGNYVNLGKYLPEELDIVGRIGPDTVWDYISKIKKSPNKEIVIVRLLPAYETETVAYTILYQYLYERNRLGVIKTTSSQIKDFYIFPLGTTSPMPPVLQPSEKVEFYEDPYRPDMLIGIVIRIIGKRSSNTVPSIQSTGKIVKMISKSKDSDTFTPPGSPKRRRSQSSKRKDEMDIDAIIKAPIVSKNIKASVIPTTTAVDDQDEPYSPGGSSGDDIPLLPVKTSELHKTADDELKRQMDEINKQIAVQEMEIAGLLSVEPSKLTGSGKGASLKPSLAGISIPSNLSQILASINNKPEPPPCIIPPAPPGTAPPPPLIGSLFRSRTKDDVECSDDAVTRTEKPAKSRLAQLSEAELLSMVPDDMLDQSASAGKRQRYNEPPPPGV